MSLDITFESYKKLYCPHCGELVDTRPVCNAPDNCRIWYDFLEQIGYYVPPEELTEENDWYGKDMPLSDEQIRLAYDFVKAHNYELYNGEGIRGLLTEAIVEKYSVSVRADW